MVHYPIQIYSSQEMVSQFKFITYLHNNYIFSGQKIDR